MGPSRQGIGAAETLVSGGVRGACRGRGRGRREWWGQQSCVEPAPWAEEPVCVYGGPKKRLKTGTSSALSCQKQAGVCAAVPAIGCPALGWPSISLLAQFAYLPSRDCH